MAQKMPVNPLQKEQSMIKEAGFYLVPVLRSCFRCGQEFRQNKQRVCTACRKPPERKKQMKRDLSFREKQVVELVQMAKLNKEIAYELHLTEGTIKEYLNRIYRKIGVSNRTELAIWAFRQANAA